MSTNSDSLSKKTYLYDCIRGPFNGIIYTGFMTLALLISIRHFEAPTWIKSCIASADSVGRFITPLTLSFGLWLGLPTAKLALRYMLAIAGLLLIAGLATNIWCYALAMFLAYILFAQPPQLMVHVYSQNYPKDTRGSRVSTMFVLSTLVGIISSKLFGYWLDIDITNYKYELFFMAACAIMCAWTLKHIPSQPFSSESSGKPIQNFSLVFKDKLFGWMVLGYFILGIGNAMVIPIRIEYMANVEYEINASNSAITIINVVIPGLSIVLSTKVWGLIFDKINFITTRLLINTCFILSYLAFFATKSLTILGLSQAINGFAVAGGMIVWNLWVTKIAPKERVPAYMSAHSSCSGIRGMIAPAIAYTILQGTSPQAVGYLGSILMIISSGMFAILWNNKRIK